MFNGGKLEATEKVFLVVLLQEVVQSSTEDKLLLELEQDIPNAILDLRARGAGTAPFQRTRERRRRNLSIQKCV